MYDDLLGPKDKDFKELEKKSNAEVCRICKDGHVDFECHNCPLNNAEEDFNAT